MPAIQRDAPYEQVAEHYRAEIKAGRLDSGSELPSLSGLMDEWAVARSTAQRALDVLRHEGWIVTRPGKPAVVADHPPVTGS